MVKRVVGSVWVPECILVSSPQILGLMYVCIEYQVSIFMNLMLGTGDVEMSNVKKLFCFRYSIGSSYCDTLC